MSFKNRLLIGTVALTLAIPAVAGAHCDTMDGPVVKAAQKALASGDITPALIWIQPAAETEVREAFAQALDVRRLNTAARALADQYFFETLVRLHRAGEGEPFTGIEPAGTDLGPIIPEADRALAAGSLDRLAGVLSADMNAALRARFDEVLATRAAMREGDVASGRAYVKAYVEFMHYVERAYETAEARD